MSQSSPVSSSLEIYFPWDIPSSHYRIRPVDKDIIPPGIDKDTLTDMLAKVSKVYNRYDVPSHVPPLLFLSLAIISLSALGVIAGTSDTLIKLSKNNRQILTIVLLIIGILSLVVTGILVIVRIVRKRRVQGRRIEGMKSILTELNLLPALSSHNYHLWVSSSGDYLYLSVCMQIDISQNSENILSASQILQKIRDKRQEDKQARHNARPPTPNNIAQSSSVSSSSLPSLPYPLCLDPPPFPHSLHPLHPLPSPPQGRKDRTSTAASPDPPTPHPLSTGWGKQLSREV